MSQKRFLTVGLAALIIVVCLLVVGGTAIYRGGWSQGYMMGRLAAGGDDGAIAPYALYGYPRSHFGLSPFLCGAGLFVLLLVVMGQFFRFRAWKMVAREGWPKGGHWAKHWHRHHGPMPHGPMPPWCWGREEPSEEEAEKTEPNGDTGETEPES
jgi:hypothetical protein